MAVHVVAATLFCAGVGVFYAERHDAGTGAPAGALAVGPASTGTVRVAAGEDGTACRPVWGPLDERRVSDEIRFEHIMIGPDGSGTIAGKAPAGAVVQAVHACPGSGGSVAGTDGRFNLAVTGIPAGKHVIRLRGTLQDGSLLMSRSGIALTLHPGGAMRPEIGTAPL